MDTQTYKAGENGRREMIAGDEEEIQNVDSFKHTAKATTTKSPQMNMQSI